MLVDKKTNNEKDTLNNPNKSIFSIGDIRHELVCKESTDFFTKQVQPNPKEFMAWDDGKRFNPKLKKDK